MHAQAPGSFCLRTVSSSISYPSLPLKFVQVFCCLLVPLNSQISSSSSAVPNAGCVSSLLEPFLALFYLCFLVLLPSVVSDSQPLPLIVFPQAGFSEKEGLSDHAASYTPFRVTWKPFGQFYTNLTGVESLEINEFLHVL